MDPSDVPIILSSIATSIVTVGLAHRARKHYRARYTSTGLQADCAILLERSKEHLAALQGNIEGQIIDEVPLHLQELQAIILRAQTISANVTAAGQDPSPPPWSSVIRNLQKVVDQLGEANDRAWQTRQSHISPFYASGPNPPDDATENSEEHVCPPSSSDRYGNRRGTGSFNSGSISASNNAGGVQVTSNSTFHHSSWHTHRSIEGESYANTALPSYHTNPRSNTNSISDDGSVFHLFPEDDSIAASNYLPAGITPFHQPRPSQLPPGTLPQNIASSSTQPPQVYVYQQQDLMAPRPLPQAHLRLAPQRLGRYHGTIPHPHTRYQAQGPN